MSRVCQRILARLAITWRRLFQSREWDTTFREAVEGGTARIEDVDDWVERWNSGDPLGWELHERLGLTWEEYGRWAEDPDALGDIIRVAP